MGDFGAVEGRDVAGCLHKPVSPSRTAAGGRALPPLDAVALLSAALPPPLVSPPPPPPMLLPRAFANRCAFNTPAPAGFYGAEVSKCLRARLPSAHHQHSRSNTHGCVGGWAAAAYRGGCSPSTLLPAPQLAAFDCNRLIGPPAVYCKHATTAASQREM